MLRWTCPIIHLFAAEDGPATVAYAASDPP